MMNRYLISLSCVCMLSGCAVDVPPYSLKDPGVIVPGSWAAGSTARSGVDAHWVERFNDSRLNKLVAVGLSANKDLAIAQSRVDRARTAVSIVRSNLKPTASLELNSDRTERNFIGFPFGSGGPASSISETNSLTLRTDWEIDLWGRIRAGESAAIAELQSEGQTYRAARVSLVAQIARAYFGAVEAAEQVELAQGSLTLLGETEEAIRERYETASGEAGSASQLRLAMTDIATAKATLAEREGLLDQSKRQLEILLGSYPKGVLAVRKRLPALPSRPPAGLPSGLLTRRPDILAAERLYAASTRRIKEAHLAKFPSFTLTGSVGTTSESLSDVIDSNFGVWSLGRELVQPILLNGRTQAEISAREATKRESLAQLQKTVLAAFGEVEQALASEKNLADRIRATDEALELAVEAADSAQRDYEGGNGDVFTLLTAKNRRISIASQLASLRRDHLVNRVDLHLALGGDYKASSQ